MKLLINYLFALPQIKTSITPIKNFFCKIRMKKLQSRSFINGTPGHFLQTGLPKPYSYQWVSPCPALPGQEEESNPVTPVNSDNVQAGFIGQNVWSPKPARRTHTIPGNSRFQQYNLPPPTLENHKKFEEPTCCLRKWPGRVCSNPVNGTILTVQALPTNIMQHGVFAMEQLRGEATYR